MGVVVSFVTFYKHMSTFINTAIVCQRSHYIFSVCLVVELKAYITVSIDFKVSFDGDSPCPHLTEYSMTPSVCVLWKRGRIGMRFGFP